MVVFFLHLLGGPSLALRVGPLPRQVQVSHGAEAAGRAEGPVARVRILFVAILVRAFFFPVLDLVDGLLEDSDKPESTKLLLETLCFLIMTGECGGMARKKRSR